MAKVILLLFSVNIVFINCASIEKNWHHPAQQEVITHTVTTGEVMGGHDDLRNPVTSIVTEENVVTEQHGAHPIPFLPTFIQGVLPSVVSQTIAQLASFIPGFQRTGLENAGLGYNPLIVVYPGYPGNLGGIYGQQGYPENLGGIYGQQRYSGNFGGIYGHQGYPFGQLGYLPGQAGYLPGQQIYIPEKHGYYPEWLSGLSPYGRYRRESLKEEP